MVAQPQFATDTSKIAPGKVFVRILDQITMAGGMEKPYNSASKYATSSPPNYQAWPAKVSMLMVIAATQILQKFRPVTIQLMVWTCIKNVQPAQGQIVECDTYIQVQNTVKPVRSSRKHRQGLVITVSGQLGLQIVILKNLAVFKESAGGFMALGNSLFMHFCL